MSIETEMYIKKIFDSLTEMQRQIERMFREFWKSAPKELRFGFYEPLVDIEDRGDEYVVYVNVPGFSKDEVKVRVTEDFVEVSAEHSEEKKKEITSKNYVLRERVYEGFRRRIELPAKVRPESASASLKDGVLEIHLPKSGAAREIEVAIS